MSDNYVGFHFDWIEQWAQIFQRCNWYTFDLIKVEFEDDRMMGGVEVSMILLGLGFRLRWNYKETEQFKEVKKMAEGVVNGDIETFEWKDDK